MDITDYSVNMGHNDFRIQIMTVEELLYRFDETDAIQSISDFRRPTMAQSSRIIESVLLGMPQPMLFIDGSMLQWIIIEGAERLLAYYSFCRNGMPLTSLYFKKMQYEGATFESLSPLAKSNILNTKVTVNILNPGLSRHDRFGIYMCLKSRIDSVSLRWCRMKVFPKEYEWVTRLAKECSVQNKTDSSKESMICYLLVGLFYSAIMKNSGHTQIDAVANMFLEEIYDEKMTDKVYLKCKSVLDGLRKPAFLMTSYPKLSGAYYAILYHLTSNGWQSNPNRLEELRKTIKRYYEYLNSDSAESFCKGIYRILMEIK